MKSCGFEMEMRVGKIGALQNRGKYSKKVRFLRFLLDQVGVSGKRGCDFNDEVACDVDVGSGAGRGLIELSSRLQPRPVPDPQTSGAPPWDLCLRYERTGLSMKTG